MKVFYHKNCTDGVAAAAIANYWFKEAAIKNLKFTKIKYIGMFYKDEFPLDTVEKDEEILIVDFSIQPEEMIELLKKTKNVTWIDHHRSALEKYKNFNRAIKGIRSEDRSGAYLTWSYFTKDTAHEKVPRVIELVNDHDLWIHKLPGSEDFKSGAMLCGDMDPENLVFWSPLLEGDEDQLQKVIDIGAIISDYQEMWRKKAEGYEIEFEGLKLLVMNKPGNSRAFKYIDDGKCDAGMTWSFDGKLYVYNLWHLKKGAKDQIDLSKIAAKYGGGGHPGACGFHSEIFYACENPPKLEE